VIDNRYRSAQGGMGHFRHLLDGGFLQVATAYEEAAAQVAGILAGEDRLAAGRREFVRRFVRPRGMDTPASGIMAQEIVAFAQASAARTRKQFS
jgi:hypothetical protein